MVGHSPKCVLFLLGRKRILGIIATLPRRNGLDIVTVNAFVVVRLANILDGSVCASAMRLSHLLWDTGRED
jgi:hypothetical protein